METMQKEELISALADGQLRGDAFSQGLDAAASDPAARQAWRNYHLIGDVLRSAELASGTEPGAFLGRFQLLMLKERQLSVDSTPPADAAALDASSGFTTRAAANDNSFRWKLLAGVASLAAVGAISWSVLSVPGAAPPQAQIAVGPAAAPVAAPREVMIRDPHLDEFLAAHRQSGASALQAPAGFLRNATFEGPGR